MFNLNLKNTKLYRFGRTCHAPMRNGLFIEVENDELYLMSLPTT
jgi:hypothetical protein